MPDSLVEQTIQHAKKAPRKRRKSEKQISVKHSHNDELDSSSVVVKKCARKSLDKVVDKELELKDENDKSLLSPYEKRKQNIPSVNPKIKVTLLKHRKQGDQEVNDGIKLSNTSNHCEKTNDVNAVQEENDLSGSSGFGQSNTSTKHSEDSSLDNGAPPVLCAAETMKMANTYHRLDSFNNTLNNEDNDEDMDDDDDYGRWLQKSTEKVGVLDAAMMALRQVANKTAPDSPQIASEVTSSVAPSPLSGVSMVSDAFTL